MRHLRFPALVAGLMLLAQGAVQAQYKVQPIIKLGDKVEDFTIKVDDGDFEIEGYNDAGNLLFVTENEDGGEMLVQLVDGKPFVIAVQKREAPAPIGTWPDGVGFFEPTIMNRDGNVVFTPVEGNTAVGTFLWDLKTKTVKPVAVKGMIAANNLAFEEPGTNHPSLNNLNEVAFAASVKNAAGQPAFGVFVLDRNNKYVAVALPDQEILGNKLIRARWPSINDAGAVAFHGRRDGDVSDSLIFLWDKGTYTQVAGLGDAPGGGKFVRVYGVRLTNQNTVAMVARLDNIDEGPFGLYLFGDGKLRQVATPGQSMPGGGTLKTLVAANAPGLFGISQPNDAGQVAFLATLDDGASAVYVLNADGSLTLALKSGQTTEIGKIENVGEGGGQPTPSIGVAINNKGQIAVTVLPENADDTVVVLTPPAQ